MKDARMKGTGNSRYLKSVANFLGLYPTYEDFAAALIEGTLPVDFNGRNQAGWDELGTDLNKANLLKDTTAALYGKTAQAVPDDIFAAIRTLITQAQSTANGKSTATYGSYTGTNRSEINTSSHSYSKTLTFPFTPYFVCVWGGRSTILFLLKGSYTARSMMISNDVSGGSNGELSVNWSGASVTWSCGNWSGYPERPTMTEQGMPYYYAAFGA